MVPLMVAESSGIDFAVVDAKPQRGRASSKASAAVEGMSVVLRSAWVFALKLCALSALGKISHAVFNPTFKIRGTSVVLHPLEIVSIPVDRLGVLVGSLSDQGQSIVAALDELLTQA
jgi:hypothetical protein